MTKVQAFIFDLDGVITDTAEQHYLAWKLLGEELGIPFDREFNETLKGVSRMDSLERILKLGNLQDDFTLEAKEALATKKNDHYKQLITSIKPDDVLPGIIDLLQAIRAEGLKIGLASASKNALTVIESLQIREYFDYIVDAATVKNSKPHPEVFLKAAEKLGVPYSACIGVEDAEAGVDAIKSADMFAVGVGSKGAMQEADLIVESTANLSLESILKAFGSYQLQASN